MKKKISKFIIFIFLLIGYQILFAQSIIQINGYMVIEQFIYKDIIRGDVVYQDYNDFNVYFFKTKEEALDNIYGSLQDAGYKTLYSYNPTKCIELLPILDLRNPVFSRRFMQKLEDSLTSELVFFSYNIMFDKRKYYDCIEKENYKKKYYIMYKIKWDVLSGDYLKIKFGQCNVNREKEERSGLCPYYYFSDEFAEIEYLFTIIK